MTSQPDNTDELDLLTAYALDALEPDEVAQVSRLLEERPELRRTLAELRATVAELPRALEPATPPPDLRQRTLDRALGRAPAARERPARQGWWRGLALGLGGLAGALLVAVALLWGQLASARAELAQMEAQQRAVAEVILQPDALASLAGSGGRGAIVRRADGALVLAASLPPLEAGRVYQLWFIRGQEAPVPSDTFGVDQQGLALITLSDGAQALAADTFAVTEEPAGGSAAPTSDPVLVGGVATFS